MQAAMVYTRHTKWPFLPFLSFALMLRRSIARSNERLKAASSQGLSRKTRKEPSPPSLPGMLTVPAGKYWPHTSFASN